ncbi:MAG: hypothetical protein L6Q84_35765 [Polyangiaceae bacterium]|nr:hypothetical protein [Polyangiaceae bacterium]
MRALLGYDRKLCAEVVSAFMAEVDRSLRWRAKRELGLASVADAHTGGVAAVQRTDSALRLSVHFHSLVLDGVYVHESGDPRAPLEFRELDTPTHADVAEVAARTAARVRAGRHHPASGRRGAPASLALIALLRRTLEPLLAPASRRPSAAARRDREQAPAARGDQLELLGERDHAPAPRKRWAWLLAHVPRQGLPRVVFAANVETCPRCFGPMRRASRCPEGYWAEVANTSAQITRLLSEHGLGPRAPPSASRTTRVPEQMCWGSGRPAGEVSARPTSPKAKVCPAF